MSRIYVLAGPNGAGKSSIAGAMVRESGADYINPDEVARAIRAEDPALSEREANGVAWQEMKRLLERAIDERGDLVLETTLGGTTIARLLRAALAAGIEVRIWYAALATPELHIARVRVRVAAGGHDIPEHDIRRRYDASRLNLVELLPGLAALRVYDNTRDADPARGQPPEPELLLHMVDGKVVGHGDLATAPAWVKPILAAALEGHAVRRKRR
jgi:predicted ABC-type ATPase